MIFSRLSSASMAFVLLFPTVGYYTLATYVNFIIPEGSIGGIAIRVISLVVLLTAYARLSPRMTRPVLPILSYASIFLFIYSFRLIQNIYVDDIYSGQRAILVMSIFFLSGIIPAYLLAAIERGINDRELAWATSAFSFAFVVGIIINRDALAMTSESRMTLDKVNPIALAYVSSSFLLFYFLRFTKSKWTILEALSIVPILLVVVSLSRSRGMMISTAITFLVYVLVLKGNRRIWAVAGLATAAVMVLTFLSPEYQSIVFEALSRIDVDNDMSTAGRALAFKGAWAQFLENPFFGRYVVERLTGYYPHNIYIESLMSVGLVGTVPFAIHLVMALRSSIGLIRNSEGSFAGAFVALLFIREAVGAAASGGIWSVSGFWISSFLVIVMWQSKKVALTRSAFDARSLESINARVRYLRGRGSA
ncbi:hypothetical protein CIT26_09455 [Mesorhizobium temperatum]|uniref:O-antigen ligase-related domain-containing protein n=2 Tax=Mesorhizobium temperatum TaxID=241416 RepID=A0A271LSP3_9HYPH|nr:hypothetical protein CIT26_09455 [Mesorhizobium temperatum]